MPRGGSLTEENGYRNVEKIIEEAKNNRAQILMHNVNLLEVYYDIYKLYDETSAIDFLDEIKNAPIKLVAEVNDDIIINAGKLKRKYKISLADSIGLAETIISNGMRMPVISDSQDQYGLTPAKKVMVRIRLDGSLSILWKGKSLLVEELPKSAQGQKVPWGAWQKGTFLLRLDTPKNRS